MVPPIPLGTLLRQRYLIQAVLGQGGFGRTYLAIDQERFDERCVLKEFLVPDEDEALLNKSRTLFQREANTLYKLQHPQVPRFWAAFETDQRLFLVQEFADGQTYRQLLTARKEQGQVFSEPEVRLFLAEMLPVLTYLHGNGIIHRDISPENIVLKAIASSPEGEDERLPMLIDFGAVKQATMHWPQTSAITRVGKIGYAPPEQLQTGQVYPNSDLYSLAATCLVLLTGKEPRSLLDGQTLDWRWQIHATISDEFGAILKRMLSVYPGDRYQSADAVAIALQALQSGSSETVQTTQWPSPGVRPMNSMPASAYSPRSVPPLTDSAESARTAYPSPDWATPTALEHRQAPLALRWPRQKGVRLGMLAAFIVGMAIAGSLLWKLGTTPPTSTGDVWVSGARLPQSEASRIIGYGSANSTIVSSSQGRLGPKEVPISTPQPQLIEFPAGKFSTRLEGHLGEHNLHFYVLPASEGQILTTSLSGAGVVMNVLRSNQTGLDAAAYQTRSWTGQLPADDHYQIQVAGSGPYTLAVAVTPTSRPIQDKIERVTFAHGTNGTTVTGAIAPQHIRRYLLKAKQDQLVLLRVLQGTVNLTAIAPNGQQIGRTSPNTKDWKGRLPITGDYVIEVTTTQPEEYAVSIEIF